MGFCKKDNWFAVCPTLLKHGELPDGIGCITADGRSFAQASLVEIIRAGSGPWNEFRESLPRRRFYRSGGSLKLMPGFICKLPNNDFRRLQFVDYDFTGCDFERCRFTQSVFSNTHLFGNLSGSTLRSSRFVGTTLDRCDLSDCDFSHGELNGISARRTNFNNSAFYRTMIAGHFDGATVVNADFAEAYILGSEFIDIDLGAAKNLSHSKVFSHTTLDHRTLFKSGVLPLNFYRSCGFPDNFVEYVTSLIRDPIAMKSCFLSHSSKDEMFVNRLYGDLLEQKIPCFYSPKDLRIGSLVRDSIDQAVHVNDKLLLVLSKNSIDSQWVEHEVEAALERERKEEQLILFPIMIDNAVMTTSKGWAANLRRQRHIGDFQNWKDGGAYFHALQRLLSDIRED